MSGFTTKNYKEKRYKLYGDKAEAVKMYYDTPVTKEECFDVRGYSLLSSTAEPIEVGTQDPIGELGVPGESHFQPVTARSYGEPDYSSYENCLRFWKDKIAFSFDKETEKTVVYNLSAIHKYLCEIDFSGGYRGVTFFPEFYWVLMVVFQTSGNNRIKSPEKFFNFFADTWADIYNSSDKKDNALVDTANIVIQILKNEDEEDEGV